MYINKFICQQQRLDDGQTDMRDFFIRRVRKQVNLTIYYLTNIFFATTISSQPPATFILCSVEIMKDIKWVIFVSLLYLAFI